MARLILATAEGPQAIDLRPANSLGRHPNNSIQLLDKIVSKEHCIVEMREGQFLLRDLGSLNGTYINGEKISEAPLKPGQTLRFGQVELRIDDGKPVNAQQAPAVAVSAPAPAPAPAPKRSEGGTMVMARGVSLSDLEESGTRQGGFDTNKVFSKKKNKANMYFIIGGVVLLIVIVVLIIVALNAVKSTGQP